jgi:hypothetical protein
LVDTVSVLALAGALVATVMALYPDATSYYGLAFLEGLTRGLAAAGALYLGSQ